MALVQKHELFFGKQKHNLIEYCTARLRNHVLFLDFSPDIVGFSAQYFFPGKSGFSRPGHLFPVKKFNFLLKTIFS